MLWILSALIFIRPFISSLAYLYANAAYSGLLILFLAFWLIFKRTSFEKISGLKSPLILLGLSLIISIIFSTAKLTSLLELYKYLSGLLLLLVVASLTKEGKLYLINTLVLAGMVISFLALYQYFFGFRRALEYLSRDNSLFSPFALEYIQRRRVFVPFVAPNILGGYLAMIIPLALTSRYRLWIILPFCLALLLTKSLSAFLALFAALSLYFLFHAKVNQKTLFLLFSLCIIILFIFVTRSDIPKYKEYLRPISSIILRMRYYRDTLQIIKAHPLTGVGIGNFNTALSNYTHNSYLQFWAETGILGIISLFWIIFKSFQAGLKKIGCEEKDNRNIIIAILSANTAFLSHNLMDFSFFLPEVSLIWWLTLGLIF